MYLLSAYVSTLEYAATVQNGVLKMHPQLLFFAAKVQISTSDSGPKYICGQRSKLAFQGLNKQLQIFHFLCTNMAAPSYTHTEVCCKICYVQFMCVISQNSRHGIRLFIFLFASRDLPNYLYVPVQPQDIKDIGDFL